MIVGVPLLPASLAADVAHHASLHVSMASTLARPSVAGITDSQPFGLAQPLRGGVALNQSVLGVAKRSYLGQESTRVTCEPAAIA